jgi:hypothetical protein
LVKKQCLIFWSRKVVHQGGAFDPSSDLGFLALNHKK